MTKHSDPSIGELNRVLAAQSNTIAEQERTIADQRAQILRLQTRLAARRNLAAHRRLGRK